MHYLAAKHYESNGVLYNAYALAKIVEQEKRDKRKKKKNPSDPQEVDSAGAGEPAPTGEQTAQRKRRPRDAPMKDMYQAFSGEMLIAMGGCRLYETMRAHFSNEILCPHQGILIEEDIAFHLTTRPLPEGWDDMEEVGDDVYPWPAPRKQSENGDETQAQSDAIHNI